MFTKKWNVALLATAGLICGVAGFAAAEGRSHEKWEKAKAERLQRFDLDKDGKLDKTERAAMKEAITIERFKLLDTNHDGALSLDEFKAGQMHMMHKGHHARRKG